MRLADGKAHMMDGIEDPEWVEAFINANLHRTVLGGRPNLDSVLLSAYQQSTGSAV